jgi:hypothetical protein
VFHCVLQSLHYNLVDMHKLTPNIPEVVAFPNWLSVKQKLLSLVSGLRVWSNSIPLNSEKSTTKFNGPHFTEIGRLRI